MDIGTRMCMGLDGYVARTHGWPAQLADPAWSPEAFGFVDFQRGLATGAVELVYACV